MRQTVTQGSYDKSVRDGKQWFGHRRLCPFRAASIKTSKWGYASPPKSSIHQQHQTPHATRGARFDRSQVKGFFQEKKSPQEAHAGQEWASWLGDDNGQLRHNDHQTPSEKQGEWGGGGHHTPETPQGQPTLHLPAFPYIHPELQQRRLPPLPPQMIFSLFVTKHSGDLLPFKRHCSENTHSVRKVA